MKKSTCFIAALALMVGGLNANATEWFCSTQGAGDQDGSSWDNAFPVDALGDVLENVEPTDVVYLLEGTYTGGAQVKPVVGVTVVGGFPATAKGTDVSGYDPWTYKTIFDAQGKNGTEAFIKVSGGDTPTYAKTTLKGITITGATGSETATYAGTAFNCTAAYVYLEDVVFDNNTSYCGSPVVPASGSKFHAKHCVWTNNRNINKDYTTKNNWFQCIINGRGASDNVTNIVLEGCVMVNNTIEDADARAAACYGGGMNFQDGSCNVMMVNCLADGGGMTILQNGGMMRMGNNGSLLLLAFNTFYNFNTSHATETKGKILSINGNIPYYLQSNIIVDNVAGTTVTPNYDAGTVSVGNKTDLAIFTQGFSNNHGARVPYIQSAGNNTIGGFLVATIQKDQNGEEGSMYKTTFLTDFTSDNWSAPAQGDVFAGETTAKNGRYYILPKDTYCDVNLSDALDYFSSYQEVPSYDVFKWTTVDLSVDLFGNKRAATTYRGAYDPNATSGGNPSGIATIDADADADAPCEYYNLQGIRVAEPTSGVYILRQGNRATKILR